MPSSRKYKQNKGYLMVEGLFQSPSQTGVLYCICYVNGSTWSSDVTAGSRLVSKIHLSWVKSVSLIYSLANAAMKRAARLGFDDVHNHGR